MKLTADDVKRAKADVLGEVEAVVVDFFRENLRQYSTLGVESVHELLQKLHVERRVQDFPVLAPFSFWKDKERTKN